MLLWISSSEHETCNLFLISLIIKEGANNSKGHRGKLEAKIEINFIKWRAAICTGGILQIFHDHLIIFFYFTNSLVGHYQIVWSIMSIFIYAFFIEFSYFPFHSGLGLGSVYLDSYRSAVSLNPYTLAVSHEQVIPNFNFIFDIQFLFSTFNFLLIFTILYSILRRYHL